MKKLQIGNWVTSKTSEILEILFRVFLFPNFRFCPTAKIENFDLKISEKNFRDFRGFQVFDLANIPFKIMKKNIDAFSDFLCTSCNSSIKSMNFFKNLKLADITPLHKKDEKILNITINQKGRILLNSAKILEKFIFRSSHPEVFLVKCVLKIFDKFTGEHLC